MPTRTTSRLGWAGLVACALLACAADELQPSRCPDGRCTPRDVETPGAETSTAPGAFGNSSQPSAPAAASTMPIAGMGAGAECEPGVFCNPDGPDGGCGQITFNVEVEVVRNPGNLLIIFDRSYSMSTDWNGEPRWRAAGNAIQAALDPLVDDIAMGGAVFFPSPNLASIQLCDDPTGDSCNFIPMPEPRTLSCDVDPNDASHVPFVPGPEFVGSFIMGAAGGPPPHFPVNNGMTPLLAGLQEAQRVLSSTPLDGRTTIAVITDGQPNCDWDAATANAIVSDWLAQGISTHVIGLPGADLLGPAGLPLAGGALPGGALPGGGLPGAGTDGETVLNELAQAGGTGQFITPTDPAALEMQLLSIVEETVTMGFESCSIKLTPAAREPDKLLMIVDEPGVDQKQQVPRDFGWTVSDAGDQVEITGALCDDATTGRFASITFEYGCPDLEPPPPIQPPE